MRGTVAAFGVAGLTMFCAGLFGPQWIAGRALAQSVPDPVAAAKAKIEASCLKVEYPETFAKWVDLTGDGREDVIISYAVTCDGFTNVFCNQDGCGGGVYVDDGVGGFRDAGLPPEVEPSEWRGLPAVKFRTGALKVWNGAEFTRPTGALTKKAAADADAKAAKRAPSEIENPQQALSGDEHAMLERYVITYPDRSRDDLARMILRRRPPDDSWRSAPEAETDKPAAEQPAVDDDTIETAAVTGSEAGDENAAAAEEASDEAETIAFETDLQATAEAWVAGEVDGLFVAEILSDDGGAVVQLSCRRGDPYFALSLRVAGDLQAMPRDPDALALVDFWVGRQISESRLMEYSPNAEAWSDRLSPYGRLAADLRRGVWMAATTPGRRQALGQFALRGSSRAIATLQQGCRL